MNGERLTLNSVRALKKIDPYLAAKDGQIYVVLDVTIQSVNRGKLSYNPFYFRAKDADSYEYKPEILGAEKPLQDGYLAPGEKARGTITFQFPDTDKDIHFVYDSPAILGGPGPITIDLTIS